MRTGRSVALALLALLPVCEAQATPKADLRIVPLDVEGGAAVLLRTPEGKSLLIDTGWARGLGPQPPAGSPPPPSSADRIAAAAAELGITHLDYLVMTHYHADHLSGLEALLARLPVDTFVDHGPNREPLAADATPQRRASAPQTRYPAWVAAYQGHKHITATAGEVLDIGSMRVQFVASDGNVLDQPLPGAGQANPLCATAPPPPKIGGEENNRSLGLLITFAGTRILYLGDLTWEKEGELLCPVNKIGKVDLYFVTGHGMDLSNSPVTAALDPLVAIMQNGATKGGDPIVMQTVNGYPSLQGFWRTHAIERHPELDGDHDYIANLSSVNDSGNAITLDIAPGGVISVTNGRNGFSKTYRARGQ